MKISTRRFQTRDGLSLVADVGGADNAPTVILAHGGGQTRHSWSGAMERLIQEGYHVINFDARGHGESDWAPDGN
jgi:alpha-beta hydrolase superfamily lysophospholipase